MMIRKPYKFEADTKHNRAELDFGFKIYKTSLRRNEEMIMYQDQINNYVIMSKLIVNTDSIERITDYRHFGEVRR